MTQLDLNAELQAQKAQLNAMAQVLLRVVATLEMQCVIDGARFEGQLRQIRWQNELSDQASQSMEWFCYQLRGARNARQSLGH